MSSSNPPTLEGTTAFVRDRFFVGDLTALVAVTAGTAVKIGAGSNSTVTTTASASDTLYGIALINANAGQKLTIVARGETRAVAFGTVSAGDLVGAGPAGTVQSVTQTVVSNAAVTYAYSSYVRAIATVGAVSGSTCLIDLI